MRIKTLSFEDKCRNWKFEALNFNEKLTLLVGASGVGKTQILESIVKLKKIAEGKSFNGLKWLVVFETIERKEYTWSGEFECKTDLLWAVTDTEKKEKFIIQQENLWVDGVQLIERTTETIKFNGQPIVKLPSEQSVIPLLKEEESINHVYAGFSKVSKLVDPNVTLTLTSFDSQLMKLMLNGLKTVEGIQIPDVAFELKLCLVYCVDRDLFNKIQERFMTIFPQVEGIRFGTLPNNSLELQLKEWGVENWISRSMISSGMMKTLLQISGFYLCAEGSVLLIDEFENSLGVNCMDEVTNDMVTSKRNVQFIITSHHPYIINNIPYRNWKIVTRKAGNVIVKDATDYEIGQSKHDAFIQLLQLDAFREGVE